MGNDPELAAGMVDEGDGLAMALGDGPTTAPEVNLVIGIAAAREVKREMEVHEAGIR